MRLTDRITIEEAYYYRDAYRAEVYNFNGATVPAANGGPFPAGPKASAIVAAYVSTAQTGAKTDSVNGQLYFTEDLRAVVGAWPAMLTPLPILDSPSRFQVRWDGKIFELASEPLLRKRNGQVHHWTLKLK